MPVKEARVSSHLPLNTHALGCGNLRPLGRYYAYVLLGSVSCELLGLIACRMVIYLMGTVCLL